jgi:hypothetical protein
LPRLAGEVSEPRLPGLKGSEPENPNDIKSLIDLKILKVV